MSTETEIKPSDEISLATKAAMDQMLMYFAQSYTSENLKPDDLVKTYIQAIIRSMSLYISKLSYENRMIIESELKNIISHTGYTEEEMKLAKMPIMGNA